GRADPAQRRHRPRRRADHGRGSGRTPDRCDELLRAPAGARVACQSCPLALPDHGHPCRRRDHDRSLRPSFHRRRLGGIAHSNALARLPDPLAATAIFDQAIWDTTGRAELVPPNPQLVRAGGTLINAPDLATLAAMIDVPADALRETVATY